MTTLREAALMALKALEFGHLPVADQAKHRDVMSYIEAMDVLRKALDADSMASLPEPVAWMFINAYGEAEDVGLKKAEFGATPTVPLYTAPLKREWQGLTDYEINNFDLPESGTVTIREFVRIIEAKLKEKNT
jgi:hypothetical protein